MFRLLTKAWKVACAVAGTKVVISARVYKLGLVTSLGPCKGAIEFNLQGSLQAPSDVASFNGKDGWVAFESINGLTVSGGGVFCWVHAKVLFSLTFREPYRPHQMLPPSMIKMVGLLSKVSTVSQCQVVEFFMAKDNKHGKKMSVTKKKTATYFLL